jgi:hypothetical protein
MRGQIIGQASEESTRWPTAGARAAAWSGCCLRLNRPLRDALDWLRTSRFVVNKAFRRFKAVSRRPALADGDLEPETR